MELNIIKQIKDSLKQIRRAKHKVVQVVEKPKPAKPIKTKSLARKRTTTTIDGQQLSLSQIAKQYNLEIATVRARYRVGNRGKLLIRPSHRQAKPT